MIGEGGKKVGQVLKRWEKGRKRSEKVGEGRKMLEKVGKGRKMPEKVRKGRERIGKMSGKGRKLHGFLITRSRSRSRLNAHVCGTPVPRLVRSSLAVAKNMTLENVSDSGEHDSGELSNVF